MYVLFGFYNAISALFYTLIGKISYDEFKIYLSNLHDGHVMSLSFQTMEYSLLNNQLQDETN